jgi:hypothetical protein
MGEQQDPPGGKHPLGAEDAALLERPLEDWEPAPATTPDVLSPDEIDDLLADIGGLPLVGKTDKGENPDEAH